MERKATRKVNVGSLTIGGKSPIVLQSMNNTDTRDVKATLEQIRRLHEAGCDLTRVAILNMEAALALKEIMKESPLPVVADIHFDYRLALESIRSGASKIRINPGNIGDASRVQEIANACKERGIPIRVGVNSGSVGKDMIAKYGGVNASSLSQSVLQSVRILENLHFDNIVVSIKSSDPLLTIQSYRMLSERIDYPLHVGVTEAGTKGEGIIRSAVGIGTLLAEGIGDTIRVSLTDDPVEEIRAGLRILRSLSLRNGGMRLVSCPTCGRTLVPLIPLAKRVEDAIADLPYDMTVAVMGCAVNGPGEAREADIGIAGGIDEFLLFKHGESIRKIKSENVFEELMNEIHLLGKQQIK